MAAEIQACAIVTAISVRTVARILAEARIKPHRSRYWLNADPETFAAAVKTIWDLYAQAFTLYAQGVCLLSTDEKTGMQTL